MKFTTPLRYPGGKSRLTGYIGEIIDKNNLKGGAYAEPFCGGAGIALSLLYAEKVDRIYLNDLDRSVYAFWYSAVHYNEELCRRIKDTPINIQVWNNQKNIQKSKAEANLLELGFSTFFLNRTNISGIITGGVIGGNNQNGNWKIDARFNKNDLIKRIEMIKHHKDKITVTKYDVMDFINKICPKLPTKTLVYFDPPYFNKGQALYKNFFNKDDHIKLALKIQNEVRCPWLVSYDNVSKISSLYSKRSQEAFVLSYSANIKRLGSELMIFKDDLEVPNRVYTSRSLAA